MASSPGLVHLSGAMRAARAGGIPLPTVWQTLSDAGVHFRRGQLVLIAAGSGVGKSVFALTLALRSGAKGVYTSADTSPHDQTARTVSIIGDIPVDDVADQLDKGNYYESLLRQVNNLRWNFHSDPTLEDLDEATKAYAHLHGEWPEIQVIDNLMNVVPDEAEGGQHVSRQNVLLYLKAMAQETGACTVVLQHLVGEYESGDRPAPLSALMDKTGKLPEVVLSLFRDDSLGRERLGVAILKNRGGAANAAAKRVVYLDMDLSRMSIQDPAMPSDEWRRTMEDK